MVTDSRDSRSMSTQTGLSPVTYEQHPWNPSASSVHVSRTQLRRHSGPYRAAVLPDIADIDLVLPSSVLAESQDAALELSRLDEYLSGQLGEGADGTGPLATILLRTESSSSSQIENITVGTRQIALDAIGEISSANAKLVSSNAHATIAARRLGNDLSVKNVLTMHETLLATSSPAIAGHLRTEQVWIGGSGFGPHLADSVPPHPGRIGRYLDDLTRFADRTDVPSLAHAAIAHAQFETIHPFVDGNGRTGRALIHAMLTRAGITTRAVLPISAGLLTDTTSYFAALTAYRAGDPVPIVQRLAHASQFAAVRGRRLIDDLASVRDENAAKIKARADSAAWPLNDLLISQPIVNTAYVSEHLGVSKMAAQTAIDRLVTSGVLVESTKKIRGRVWQAPTIIALLDEFGESIRRGRP